MTMQQPPETAAWRPESDAPADLWLITRRAGEDGTNFCHLRIWPEGDREWIDQSGRTTITHHSFAAPTEWRHINKEIDVER